MDALEDDNPFDQDGEHITSETSSTSKLDLSEPPSPPLATRHFSTSSPISRPFPSPGSHRQPQMSFKSDFCCSRDRVLHSGEDVEILVRESVDFSHLYSLRRPKDHRRTEDFR
jgi:hypothetical protein